MDLYLLSNARVFYNSARGGVFMWSLLSGLALSWVIFMFLKKRMGEGKGKGDVYKGEGKEEQTENEISRVFGIQRIERRGGLRRIRGRRISMRLRRTRRTRRRSRIL